MKPITRDFPIEFEPQAYPEAVVQTAEARFTLLTGRLLRLEYSSDGRFEDRPSQTFWQRRLPVPEFEARQVEGKLIIETDYLLLAYVDGRPFAADTLTITLKDNGTTWHFGDDDALNLRGTARTLDQVDGTMELEPGLLSRGGWTVYDDSERLVFNEDGWLVQREAGPNYRDLMFFGYGRDFAACLRDFTLVAGPAPMIPRFALGNWWSRYCAYTADELLGVVDEFQDHGVPLSVCIVDMDWHIVETGNACSGWTGHTWNRDLFPDPQGFIASLHDRGLKTAINLHPAEGVHSHEVQYAAMCADLGLNPEAGQPVAFDIADPRFTRAYFKHLHHPQEEDGVDFWWIDWQQGTRTTMKGLDPLPWLNHLHFYDLGRDGQKRPFIFSRWGGLGGHRTPIGFSGDTVITWDSLAFQPYFTATAANVNFGWWSHDIGGHFGGFEEPQLYTRWVQFGLFSPILRLHSTNNPFHERRPWGWDAETERISSAAMRLRHQFIPYIYSMAWRNHTASRPLIRPMYHAHAEDEQAYHCPDQYFFGSELIAAPFLEPLDEETRMSRQVVWLPRGEWFGFFDNLPYAGDGWHAIYGGLDDIPVFAKAGAIIPLGPETHWGGLQNPQTMIVHLFPGADNLFDLYEDDGLETYSLTPIEQRWSEDGWQVNIGPVQGETNHLPASRTWHLLFRGLKPGSEIGVLKNGWGVKVSTRYDESVGGLEVIVEGVETADNITVTVPAGEIIARDGRLERCRRLVRSARIESYTRWTLDNELTQIVADPSLLDNYQLQLSASQMRALLEIIGGAGYHRRPSRQSTGQVIILWNNQGTEEMRFNMAGLDVNKHGQAFKGKLPGFAVLLADEQEVTWHQGRQLGQGRVTLAGWLEGLVDRVGPLAEGAKKVLGLGVTGENGRDVTVIMEDGCARLEEGLRDDAEATIKAAHDVWLAMINGEVTPEELFVQGKLEMQSSVQLLQQLGMAFDIVPPGHFLPDQWRLQISYRDLLHMELP